MAGKDSGSVTRYFCFFLPPPLSRPRVASTPLKRGDRKSKLTESDSLICIIRLFYSERVLPVQAVNVWTLVRSIKNVNRAYYIQGEGRGCTINFSQFSPRPVSIIKTNISIAVCDSRGPKIWKKRVIHRFSLSFFPFSFNHPFAPSNTHTHTHKKASMSLSPLHNLQRQLQRFGSSSIADEIGRIWCVQLGNGGGREEDRDVGDSQVHKVHATLHGVKPLMRARSIFRGKG